MQARPRALNLLQLAETLRAEVVHGAYIARLRRVRAELPVEQRPCEPQRALESERPVCEPEVEVEAEGRPLHRLEDVQVERDRVGYDFVKELLAKLDFTLPQRTRVRLALAPPILCDTGDRRLKDYGPEHLPLREL